MRRARRSILGLGISIALLATLAVPVSAAPAGQKSFRASGAFDSASFNVTFTSKVARSTATWGAATGAIDLDAIGVAHVLGSAVCGGTTPAGYQWTFYVSTNFNTSDNTVAEALLFTYQDIPGSDAFEVQAAPASSTCAAMAGAAATDQFGPDLGFDTGFITVKFLR